MPDSNRIAAHRRRVQMYNDSLALYNLQNLANSAEVQLSDLRRRAFGGMPYTPAEEAHRQRLHNVYITLSDRIEQIRNRLFLANGEHPQYERIIFHGPNAWAEYKKPTPPAPFRPPAPERMNVRIPTSTDTERRPLIGAPLQRFEEPKYRFAPGFVDPRVAAEARQSAADGELLTREQLEYRNRTMRRQATPMTF